MGAAEHQDTTVADTLAVVEALRRHLKEDNCNHSIKSILRESLKSKSGLRPAKTSSADTDTDADTDTEPVPEPHRNDQV